MGQRSTVTSGMSEHLERLARTPFFADASTPLLAMVANASRTRTLVRGDVLFNEGDPPDALYLVTAGRIAIEGGLKVVMDRCTSIEVHKMGRAGGVGAP